MPSAGQAWITLISELTMGREVRIRILLSSSKISKKKTWIPTVLWLFNDFLSLKIDVNVPSKRNKQKIIFVGILKVNDKIADPDPDPLVIGTDPRNRIRANVTDPQHWFLESKMRTFCPSLRFPRNSSEKLTLGTQMPSCLSSDSLFRSKASLRLSNCSLNNKFTFYGT